MQIVQDRKPIAVFNVGENKERDSIVTISSSDSQDLVIREAYADNERSAIKDDVSSQLNVASQGSSTSGLSFDCDTHTSCSPLTRQFWSAGDYGTKKAVALASRNNQNRLTVHPKFLHSNATSHKWAFGAIAELLDNAVDEIHNGATCVIIDKVCYSNNENIALLVQDDGSGMNPDSLRLCMGFGFSDKQSNSSIGHYGNGFKTSTMRLGADVIVFTRSMKGSELTQSVGLLSYTFLTQSGYNDIIVPMIDYHFDAHTRAFTKLLRNGQKQFSSNLSVLLKWSPFRTEEELLKNFDSIGDHGTRIIVYNLWFNDTGNMELDFQSDKEDILIRGGAKPIETKSATVALVQNHISNRLNYSLRAYCSILYLHLPDHFKIILRGMEVEHHNFIHDLQFVECIMYKPKCQGRTEAEVVTTLGFLKDAPFVSLHGFNIYHKNRLILPFCKVVTSTGSRGRGIAGVLEANFIKPTHDKQGFEKSSLYQKLESRLKEMTYEYWEYHCHLIGYEKKLPPSNRQSSATSQPLPLTSNTMNSTYPSIPSANDPAVIASLGLNPTASKLCINYNSNFSTGVLGKRGIKDEEFVLENEPLKRQAVQNSGKETEIYMENGYNLRHSIVGSQIQSSELNVMIQEQEKLRVTCKELEGNEKELLLKKQNLRLELEKAQQLQKKLFAELQMMACIKTEK